MSPWFNKPFDTSNSKTVGVSPSVTIKIKDLSSRLSTIGPINILTLFSLPHTLNLYTVLQLTWIHKVYEQVFLSSLPETFLFVSLCLLPSHTHPSRPLNSLSHFTAFLELLQPSLLQSHIISSLLLFTFCLFRDYWHICSIQLITYCFGSGNGFTHLCIHKALGVPCSVP